MDAATLRIILLVIGSAFLVALFFWERHHKAKAQASRKAKSRAHVNIESKLEPNLGLDERIPAEDISPECIWYDQPAAPTSKDKTPQAPATEADPYQEYPSSDIDAADLVGTMTDAEDGPVVQVFLVAHQGRRLSGHDILTAASRHLLIAGKKDIFHRLDGDPQQPRILFSMANLVQPGSFPLRPDPNEGMAEFETRGLALFTQVHGESQDIEALDTMLTTAKSLARELKAEVEDAQHRPITVKRIDSLRTSVLSYGARAQHASEPVPGSSYA
ncbi:cell division protein ZipA C-terminal FtsZ-binding domain-containing protein [Rhabdochromatium marinum]|uniref:cell division protein ZipA C-terminal FtsZ-binding domain-containing protein n=1 Tax=Rhabdochromatium marinum TaxID=48729 RepID=UPI0019061919|nr:cell division protein ZipA C-terminal FtsZ-binding domain-containing protein [Rhabdochromatium marinum]MBK1649011.1 hypothetical protein [Rhabdochromatium marinum]